MTFLLYGYLRLTYWLHRRVHGACEKRAQYEYWRGWCAAAREAEKGELLSVTVEQQIRDAIARAGW